MLLHSLTYCICTLKGTWAMHADTYTHHHWRALQWWIEICLGCVVQSIVPSHADGTLHPAAVCCVSTCILSSFQSISCYAFSITCDNSLKSLAIAGKCMKWKLYAALIVIINICSEIFIDLGWVINCGYGLSMLKCTYCADEKLCKWHVFFAVIFVCVWWGWLHSLLDGFQNASLHSGLPFLL